MSVWTSSIILRASDVVHNVAVATTSPRSLPAAVPGTCRLVVRSLIPSLVKEQAVWSSFRRPGVEARPAAGSWWEAWRSQILDRLMEPQRTRGDVGVHLAHHGALCTDVAGPRRGDGEVGQDGDHGDDENRQRNDQAPPASPEGGGGRTGAVGRVVDWRTDRCSPADQLPGVRRDPRSPACLARRGQAEGAVRALVRKRSRPVAKVSAGVDEVHDVVVAFETRSGVE